MFLILPSYFIRYKKIRLLSSHCKSNLFVKLPAFRSTIPIFGITVARIPSTVELAVILNGEIFVSYVVGHLCTLVYCELLFCPVNLISNVSVEYWQGSIVIIIVITAKWLKIWRKVYRKMWTHKDFIYFQTLKIICKGQRTMQGRRILVDLVSKFYINRK